MLQKYLFGNPIDTQAVVLRDIKEENSKLLKQYIQVKETKEEIVFLYPMEREDIVYGLGENVRGINKRGWIYESKCSDDPFHLEDKHSLYGAHNFIIIDGQEDASKSGLKRQFGLFVDHPGKVIFDIGYSNINELKITIPNNDVAIYVIQAQGLEAIVKEFRTLIGKSYIAPKWAFGYGQSRWSYMDAEEIRELVKAHRAQGIPLDSVYLDIDYMEKYKDFTINNEKFPKFCKFTEEMKEQGIHLVPIIDAGVKIEEGYDVYEEGVEKGYFCKQANGKEFVAGVWPGRVHFPDMLNEEARDWFGNKYQILLDKGIEGFWNDMNEPAIFYSEENLNRVFDKIEEYRNQNLDIESFFAFKDMVGNIDNNEEDYKLFYHNYQGKNLRHDMVHNLFGFNMTRAAGEAFERLCPDKRILMFSRSSYIGMHRYGGIWTGDNLSWWSHILLNIHMMPSLSMCGFLYAGADIGGFGSDTTQDLILRWLEFGIFTPLMRNHSAMGTRRQEVYQFEDTKAFKDIIEIRYGLLPYIYSEYMKAAINDAMYCKPLSFVYLNDKQARRVEDQLMIGDSIMIAPVYEQNAEGRYVYLPEDMKMIRFQSLSDREEIVMEKGHHYIEIALNQVVLFIRPDHILPIAAKGGQCVEEVDFNSLTLLNYVKEGAEYTYYQDDGYGKDYENPENYVAIQISKDGEATVKQFPFSVNFHEILVSIN